MVDKASKDEKADTVSLTLDEKSAFGRTWGLIRSGILGSRGDLWIAEKIDESWKNPVFTGISTLGISRWVEPSPPEP